MNNEENQIYQLNKIIREKNEDIESKDKLIASLRAQITSLQNYSYQNESLKKQTISLEEKLNNSEIENNSFITEKLRELSDSENKLRANLILKDKILYDYNNTIKDHENTICMIKRQLIEKESCLNHLKHENTELTNKWKSMTFLFNQKDEEFANYKAYLQKEVTELSKEKEYLEAKLNEFKSNNLNLSKLSNELDYKLRVMEKDLSTERNNNFNYRSILDELSNIGTKNKEELADLREIKKSFIENEKSLEKLKAELESEQIKNRQLNEQLMETSEKYKELKVKYSGENTIENLQSNRELMENENNNLKSTVETLNQLNQSYSLSLNSIKKDLTEIIENVNSEIKNIFQWIEIYLGSHFEDEMEIATLPITINKTLKDCSKLDDLKQLLSITRKKTNDEFIKLDKSNKLLRFEIEENLRNQERLIKENNELKGINNDEEKLIDLTNRLSRYEAIITKIQNFYHQMNKTEITVNNEKSKIEELENDVLKLLGILESNINKFNSSENQKLRLDYDRLKEDIINESKGNDSIRLSKKNEEIELLKLEIENLKKELEKKDYIIKLPNSLDKGDKLNEIAMLEKRITNLLREIELKDIQITSQEQMINRRNREIEEFRNKSAYNNTNTDKSFHSTQKYKNLEVYNHNFQGERENFTKENSSLMKENKDLKERLNKLINNSIIENHDNFLKELQKNLNICEEEIKNKDILIRQLLAENRYLKQIQSFNRLEETQKTAKSEVKELSQEVKGIRSKLKKQNN